MFTLLYDKRKNSDTKAPDQSGFTVTELAMVMAILSILAVVTIPNIKAMMPRIRLNSAAQRIVTDLQFARIRAIARRKEYQVVFSGDTESYKIEEGAKAYGSSWPGTIVDTIRDFDDVNNSYYFKGIDFDAGNITLTFSPKGLLSSGSSTIKIMNSNEQKKSIKINIAGRIKVLDGWL
ncbi:MAG: GspH/FimT family pseudopilin [bacterium]